jgi:hypothetical protein
MSNLGSTLTQSLTLAIIGVGAAALKSFEDMEKMQNALLKLSLKKKKNLHFRLIIGV